MSKLTRKESEKIYCELYNTYWENLLKEDGGGHGIEWFKETGKIIDKLRKQLFNDKKNPKKEPYLMID